MLISFVIPCYRSTLTLEQVVEDIQKLREKREGYDIEIILVNDGSPDDTFQLIRRLAERYENIIGIDIAKNRGQQSALMAGLKYANGDLIMSCDDDGQTPVETAFQLIDKLDEGKYDVVCANYTSRGKRSLMRRIGTYADRKMVKLFLDKPDEFNTAIYFVARRFVIEEIIKYDNPFPYWEGLLLRTTHNIGNIEVAQKERSAGESNYTIRKLLSLWISGLTTFSIKPLRFATLTGSILAFVGFVIIVLLVIFKLTRADVEIGWTSLIATNILIGGMIMLILGIIGEYIGRIYLGLNQEPQYVIKQVIGKHSSDRNQDGKQE